MQLHLMNLNCICEIKDEDEDAENTARRLFGFQSNYSQAVQGRYGHNMSSIATQQPTPFYPPPIFSHLTKTTRVQLDDTKQFRPFENSHSNTTYLLNNLHKVAKRYKQTKTIQFTPSAPNKPNHNRDPLCTSELELIAVNDAIKEANNKKGANYVSSTCKITSIEQATVPTHHTGTIPVIITIADPINRYTGSLRIDGDNLLGILIAANKAVPGSTSGVASYNKENLTGPYKYTINGNTSHLNHMTRENSVLKLDITNDLMHDYNTLQHTQETYHHEQQQQGNKEQQQQLAKIQYIY